MPEQEQKNVAIVTRWVNEVFNAKNMQVVDEVKSEESYASNSPFPGTQGNLSGFRQAFSHVLTAFPDFAFNVDEISAKDDIVIVRANWTGTHKGEYLGVAASGIPMQITRVDMMRLQGDKIVEHWGFGDDWNKIKAQASERGLDSPNAPSAPVVPSMPGTP